MPGPLQGIQTYRTQTPAHTHTHTQTIQFCKFRVKTLIVFYCSITCCTNQSASLPAIEAPHGSNILQASFLRQLKICMNFTKSGDVKHAGEDNCKSRKPSIISDLHFSVENKHYFSKWL